MTIVLQDDWLTVHHGDVRAVLPTLAGESVDAVVTSPPYWRQRSYLADDDPLKPLELGSEPTFDEWVANLLGICSELKRVLKPAGSLWMVLGDRFVAHGGQYPNTAKRRRGEDFQRHVPRRSTLTGYPEGLRRKSLVLAPYRLAIALCDDGWILRDRIVWAKTNGLPESISDRLHVRDEVIFRFTLREKAYFDVDAIRERYAVASLVRHKAGRAPTFAGSKGTPPGQPDRSRKIWTGRKEDEHRSDFHREGRIRPDGKNPGNVWPMATASRPGNDYAHFAMFPPELVRRAVLIELDPAAIEMIRRRCEARPIVEVPA